MPPVWEGDPVAVGVVGAEAAAEGVAGADGEAPDRVAVPEGVLPDDALAPAVADGEPDPVGDALGEPEADELPETDGPAEAVAVPEPEDDGLEHAVDPVASA